MSDNAAREQIARMATGYWISQALYVAAKLGIADLLADGARSAEQLAATTDTDAGALHRLLRALASLGIFAGDADGSFELNDLAKTLRANVPGSQRAMVLMMGEENYRVWGDLLYSVQTGEIAFDKTYGKPIFDYLAEHPEKAKIFDAAMTGIHGHETAQVLEAYDFSNIGTLADVGGGNGTKLTAILDRYPDMHGILFDLPHVAERAQEVIAAADAADRCQVIGGNFFESVPAGADAYLLRHIIHDWDDENSITILRNCRNALNPGGKVLIVESVIPPGNEPFFGKLLDLHMMVVPGGMERTEHEYNLLLEDAGLRLTRIVPTTGEISVVEAEKLYPEELP